MNNKITLTDEERFRTTLELLPERTVHEISQALANGLYPPDDFINPLSNYLRWANTQSAYIADPKIRKAQIEFNNIASDVSTFRAENFSRGDTIEYAYDPFYYLQPELKKESREEWNALQQNLIAKLLAFKAAYKKLAFLISHTGTITKSVTVKNYPKSIHLITPSVAVGDTIFLVLDEQYEHPVRFATFHNGNDTAIKKLHNIAYMANAPGKMVPYNEGLAKSINNDLFKKRAVKKYMQTNKLDKPTLVRKSETGNLLVLKNDTVVKTSLIAALPSQFQYLYKDKTQ